MRHDGGPVEWWVGAEMVHILGNSAYGGGVPVVLQLMEAASRLGAKPVLLATHPDVVAAVRSAGWEVWEFPGIVREPRPMHDLLTAFRLARALRKRRVRLVHTHTSKGGMVGRLGAWLARCDVIVHHTHGFYHAGLPRGLRRTSMVWLERLFGHMDDAQVFLSSSEMQQAIETGITPREKAQVLYNGVADPLRDEGVGCVDLRASWGIPDEAPIIGSVARLAIEQKGLDTALRVFRKVLERVPDCYFVLVGDGEDRSRLLALSRELRVDARVVMPGYVDGASRLNRCFTVAFAPSRREGQSVSAIEAMACGVPLVTTRIPGTQDLVVDDETALVTEVDDEDAMTDALCRVLGDAALAERLGTAARCRYEQQFTEEIFRRNAVAMYTAILQKGPYR